MVDWIDRTKHPLLPSNKLFFFFLQYGLKRPNDCEVSISSTFGSIENHKQITMINDLKKEKKKRVNIYIKKKRKK